MQKFDLLIAVLRETCTLSLAKQFLQSKSLRYSASTWDELIEKCLNPAFASKSLTSDDVLAFIQDIEEYGSQHVFLYRVDPLAARAMVDKASIMADLGKAGLADIVNNPKVLDKPDARTLAAVRWDSPQSSPTLSLKFVQKHEYHELINKVVQGNQLVVRYEIVKRRMIDIIRVSANGDIEVRLGSRSGAGKYSNLLAEFWADVAFLIKKDGVTEISLSKAKDYLLNNNSSLAQTIRYSTSTLGNDYGYTARFAAGAKTDNLAEDSGSKSGMHEFLANDGHCEEANIWFKEQPSGYPRRDLHVHVKGEINEYVLPSQGDKAEFQHVIDQLRKFNQ